MSLLYWSDFWGSLHCIIYVVQKIQNYTALHIQELQMKVSNYQKIVILNEFYYFLLKNPKTGPILSSVVT